MGFQWPCYYHEPIWVCIPPTLTFIVPTEKHMKTSKMMSKLKWRLSFSEVSAFKLEVQKHIAKCKRHNGHKPPVYQDSWCTVGKLQIIMHTQTPRKPLGHLKVRFWNLKGPRHHVGDPRYSISIHIFTDAIWETGINPLQGTTHYQVQTQTELQNRWLSTPFS
jgi:hypothetical protein